MRAWRLQAILGTIPLFAWAWFHLWEQWAAFYGRARWLVRMHSTSDGVAGGILELSVGILPALGWCGMEIWLRTRRVEPPMLRHAMAEEPWAAQRLGLLGRVGSWVFYLWLLYHVAWTWGRNTFGAELEDIWMALRFELGTYPHAALHAIGVVGLVIHTWTATTRLSVAFGWSASPASRRAARLSGLVIGLGLALLYAQLVGQHVSGFGTFWPLRG